MTLSSRVCPYRSFLFGFIAYAKCVLFLQIMYYIYLSQFLTSIDQFYEPFTKRRSITPARTVMMSYVSTQPKLIKILTRNKNFFRFTLILL